MNSRACRIHEDGCQWFLIDLEGELAATVRWLAGAQITEITLVCQLMTPTVYCLLWRIIDAINHAFKLNFPIDDVADGGADGEGLLAC